jgi:nucleoside triphosphatase
MDYTCRTDSTDVVLNEEAQEYAWVSPDDLKNYDLGGFTASLLDKLDSGEDDPHRQSIFYNY